jgi:hypothetical protein
MDDQLKKLKTEWKENTFNDFRFDSKQREKVFRRISKNKDKIDNPEKKRFAFRNRFNVVMTAVAYCGMLTLITSIVVENMNESNGSTSNHSGVKLEEFEKVPIDSEDNNDVLNNTSYEHSTYPFELTLPENWINVIKLEEMNEGVRFFYEGTDGYEQDLFQITIETVKNRLKFLYEGGPDPSKELAILGEHVYRYSLPLDMALSIETDINKYQELMKELPEVIASFKFTKENNGQIGDTPFIYGLTSHYNEIHGFEVYTPNKWKDLFEVEQSESEMKFLFTKKGTEATEFLKFMFLTDKEWTELEQSVKENEKQLIIITEKDGHKFVASVTNHNPFEKSELYYPFEMLKSEAKYVIETFQFMD